MRIRQKISIVLNVEIKYYSNVRVVHSEYAFNHTVFLSSQHLCKCLFLSQSRRNGGFVQLT